MVNLTEIILTLKRQITLLEEQREKEIQKITEHYQKKIDAHKTALEVLENLNEACLNCRGRGTLKYVDASGNYDTMTCETCGGTGRKTEGNSKPAAGIRYC